MQIRDRIKELRRVPASKLAPNPKNWRTHSIEQQDAMRGILAEVGYAGAVLARELPDGGLILIDGHLRAETSGDAPIPVLVLDVTEEEADKLLATYDPLGDLAGTDQAKLRELIDSISTDNEGLQQLFERLNPTQPVEEPQPPDEFSEFDESIETEHQCPKCGYRWSGSSEADETDSD